jgi:DNA polymerase I
MAKVKETSGDGALGSGTTSVAGQLIDVDYLNMGGEALIRITVKGSDGSAYEVYDPDFKPYFYLVPDSETTGEDRIMAAHASDQGSLIKAVRIEWEDRSIFGKQARVARVFVQNPSDVPKLSAALSGLGECYENDIPFSKRYLIDKDIVPLTMYEFDLEKQGSAYMLKGFRALPDAQPPELNVLWFDIETYNPLGVPRPEKDPVVMISYSYVSNGKRGKSVMAFKKIDLPFVEYYASEGDMIRAFVKKISELDIDIISGYNSANFDIKYLIERSKSIKVDFNISRFEGETRIERHGLVDRVKIGGRVHVDMYVVVKFISVVGAAEYILKLNSYTLKNVYEAITGSKKTNVEKKDIYKLWDGSREELEELATYNLSDSEALEKVYSTFAPIMIELTRTTGNSLSDVSVSTTGQLVEFLLMKYAHRYSELIPNKPDDREIRSRLINPIEGAYVKTPEPGIYSNLAIFDFRGLYPSIIISHNIDPSTVCTDCTDYYESPNGTKFSKARPGIMPMILKLLIDQRAEVKKLYKKDKGNIYLGSRSQALKITSNSFYGYLGYARSRWYSRECASSVTAYGRQYILQTISDAEEQGFKVIYGDTDSIVMLLGGRTREDALEFVKKLNEKLPKSMELELEDFYKRAVFVGKKSEKIGAITGAKKKYAMISENGFIKIRGFELVRRDWSRIARDTQKKVLETILNEGSAEKAVEIVKNVIKDLRDGKVPLSMLAISTQLRKGIDSYDATSPELSAAKKAVKAGLKTKDEVEHAVISYVITRDGSSISDKAVLEEFAKNYDPEYYINHQVMPSVMRILKELNLTEDELRNAGVQRKL